MMVPPEFTARQECLLPHTVATWTRHTAFHNGRIQISLRDCPNALSEWLKRIGRPRLFSTLSRAATAIVTHVADAPVPKTNCHAWFA